MESSPIMLGPGIVFHGRYRVERCLRSGGMGMLCEVTDCRTTRRRAMKTMLAGCVTDPGLRARFREEATITAQVESEHLVEIFDAGIDEETGTPFIVMELLKGEDLGDVLARRGRLAPAEVVRLLQQASQALDRTHALGIVHRDLKPENLFLTHRDDGSPRIRILDFGIAKLLGESTRARTTGVIGSPLYMSPEQAVGDGGIQPTADLYALAHVAFTLLVGEAFWGDAARQASSPVVLLAKVALGSEEPATARAAALGVTLPVSFDRWFAKATARAPRERYETASELVEALADALGVPLAQGNRSSDRAVADTLEARAITVEPQATCAPLSSDRSVSARRGRRAAMPVVAGLVGLAGLVLAGVLLGNRLTPRAPTTAPVEAPTSALGSPSVVGPVVPPLVAPPPPPPVPDQAPPPSARSGAPRPLKTARTAAAAPVPPPSTTAASEPTPAPPPRPADPSDEY